MCPTTQRWFGYGTVLMLATVASTSARAHDSQLADAVKGEDATAVRALLRQKVDVNIPQADGATALHWAAYRNDVETMELLLRAGARVNAANVYGVTPLSLACTNGN